MSEFLPENNLPLNQAAKQALRSSRQSPDPGNLYLVQLMRWAVENQKVEWELPRSRKETLLEYLEAFDAWNPEKVMQVFLESDEGEPVNLLDFLEEDHSVAPIELAVEAIEQLHSRLVAAGRYPDQAFRD